MSTAQQKPVVTFDCYGTLIRFSLGQAALEVVGDRLDERGGDRDAFLEAWRIMRFQGTSNPYQRYVDVLGQTLETAMLLFGVPWRDTDLTDLMARVEKFEVFPDVPPALEALKANGWEIALVTNSDDDLIPHHVATIGVEFDHVFTAEQAGAYKPRLQTFEYAWRQLDRPKELVVHAAQGWEYDIIPTHEQGLRRRVWINRNSGKGSAYFQPYDELSDLSGLPELLGPA